MHNLATSTDKTRKINHQTAYNRNHAGMFFNLCNHSLNNKNKISFFTKYSNLRIISRQYSNIRQPKNLLTFRNE